MRVIALLLLFTFCHSVKGQDKRDELIMYQDTLIVNLQTQISLYKAQISSLETILEIKDNRIDIMAISHQNALKDARKQKIKVGLASGMSGVFVGFVTNLILRR
jgi:hypothetical protein